ncbi:hypothetical protein [Methylobacterium oxalidis]|uniref:hypothetical protein n=1 Tax=Methylobacterium oxalidis TaxID=944322 RepID=UPI001EDD0F0B|nr:hypothetical protein [Methylobacterium oxalidis]GJE30329.1 hypothetical protein LDDCCGHA_0496 [Methylobacterium oxalidis]
MDEQSASSCDTDETTAVEAALSALIVTGNVRLSERNRRFLSFVVTETLAGRGQRIKAYTIGVDVFGRSKSFDPDRDPIVRIEATRVRAALAEYYDSFGARDAVRIVLRPGSYVPTFEFSHPASGSERPRLLENAAAALDGPIAADERAGTVIVVTHRTDRRERCSLGRGEMYVEAIIKAVADFEIKVFLTPPPERRMVTQAMRELIHRPEAVFALDIAVHGIAEGRRYSWSLSDFRTGEIKASGFDDRADDDLPAGAQIDALAAELAQRIAASAG